MMFNEFEQNWTKVIESCGLRADDMDKSAKDVYWSTLSGQLAPVCAVVGGICGQEMVKVSCSWLFCQIVYAIYFNIFQK
jgi:hypothetical protein